MGRGTEAFGRCLNHFYDLVEEEEGTLAPLFGSTVDEAHRVHAPGASSS